MHNLIPIFSITVSFQHTLAHPLLTPIKKRRLHIVVTIKCKYLYFVLKTIKINWKKRISFWKSKFHRLQKFAIFRRRWTNTQFFVEYLFHVMNVDRLTGIYLPDHLLQESKFTKFFEFTRICTEKSLLSCICRCFKIHLRNMHSKINWFY